MLSAHTIHTLVSGAMSAALVAELPLQQLSAGGANGAAAAPSLRPSPFELRPVDEVAVISNASGKNVVVVPPTSDAIAGLAQADGAALASRGVSWHPPDTLVSVREYEVSETYQSEDDWEDRRLGCCAVQ